MNDPFRTPDDYELFIYSLAEQFPSIQGSTLTFVRRGGSLARVGGMLEFDLGFRLVVRERIVFNRLPLVIDEYGYEIWHGQEKIAWYDPQPHPDMPSLQSTHPHHKHVPPDIRHNRIPAGNMSFSRPNIPELIREIEKLVLQK